MAKPIAYFMMGLPGSGKSTFAKKLRNAHLCSADEVRREWFGDESLQYTEAFLVSRGIDTAGMSDLEKRQCAHAFVWGEVKRRAMDALKRGENIVIDGVNSSRRDRMSWIETASACAVIHGIWLNTPAEVCIERDRRRTRHVSEEIIRRFAKNFQEPSLEEGFDILEIYNQNGELVSRATKE